MPSSYLFSVLLLMLGCACHRPLVETSKADGQLRIRIDNHPVLTYQFAVFQSPAGIDPVFNRSGFIHPLQNMEGDTLTQIQPKDHYHHFGLWNPWTHVLFEGDTLDFWNLKKRQGTVRFAGFKEETNRGFTSIHEHVALKNGAEKVALIEEQTVEVTPISDQQYAVDFTFDYRCATDSPFKILEYRYAGFCYRATEAWNASTSEIISSEVDTRDSIDGTRGKWCLIQDKLTQDYGAVLMMSHPDNFNFPEPLRVWPAANHEGLIMVNFSPTKNRDWLLMPQQNYVLKYRILVSNSRLSAVSAADYWQSYTLHSSRP